MYIKKLELKDFRNYRSLLVEPDPHVNLIIGRNAQGKTNLLEAVFLTSMGRSFRTQRDKEMVRFGCSSALVRAEAQKEYLDTKVEILISDHSKKSIKKDGKTVRRTSELMKNIIIVIFSPEDLRIVKDEPEKRRRFIDRELSQIKPAYFNALSEYKKALEQRNSLLKEDRVRDDLLELFDDIMVRSGAEVMEMRKRFIDRMSEFSADIHGKITNGEEKLEIRYHSNISYDENPETQRELVREALEKSRESDFRNRTTMRGPQKDDIQFWVNGADARKFGSQGQQRTCALALKLAELGFIREETGEEGILLLDDVMSELDKSRREYLVRALADSQLFITGTDVDDEILEAYPDLQIIRIENGDCISK